MEREMTVSRRQYARMRGVARQSIADAIERGALPVEADGTIDVELADATWFRRRQQREATIGAATAAEDRREQALLISTLAKVQMTRRKTEKLRAKLIERDAGEAAILDVVHRLKEGIAKLAADSDPLLVEAGALILQDLGDIEGQALKVTEQAE
jgi:hypothetical protein